MSFEEVLGLARQGQLYPSLILHGNEMEARQEAALTLSQALLCELAPQDRPCGSCRQCRRIVWPEKGSDTFHPDFQVLERDLKTSTSVDAVKRFLQVAQVSPFEARGQVFVIASAESLTGEAANALLKALEEPAVSAPRHFQLLAPSQFDLLATLRSRSLAIYLGAAQAVDEESIEAMAQQVAQCVAGFSQSGSGVYLLALASSLNEAGGWQDPRSGRPWALAARAILVSLTLPQTPPGARPRLLALADALLTGADFRIRGIPPERILEGLVSKHLLAEI